jgi:hypothetical protein
MKAKPLVQLFWLIVAPALLCAATGILRPSEWKPISANNLAVKAVYAYRQWQSLGLDLEAGDQVSIRAEGQWQYSPYVGLHGPEGGGKPVTVRTYPISDEYGGVNGGALIGRIGDNGTPFYVGRGTVIFAELPGKLYLRINDDLLGDNKGALTVNVTVTRADGSGEGR